MMMDRPKAMSDKIVPNINKLSQNEKEELFRALNSLEQFIIKFYPEINLD